LINPRAANKNAEKKEKIINSSLLITCGSKGRKSQSFLILYVIQKMTKIKRI